jgi:hypothetical protein
VQFHVTLAIVYIFYCLLILVLVVKYAKTKPSLNKFNVFFNITLFVLWTISGLVMEYYELLQIPTLVRNYSVVIHDYTTFVAIPWILVHGIGHLTNKRIPWPRWWQGKAPEPMWVQENKPNRRDFLKAGMLLFAFISIGGLIKWITPILSIPEQLASRKGYFRIYNVTNNYPRHENEQDWSLTIDGLVEDEMKLSFKNMRELQWQTIVDDFHCVTGWSVKGVEMRGIYFKDLMTHFNITPQGKYVTAYSGSFTLYTGGDAFYIYDGSKWFYGELPHRLLSEIQPLDDPFQWTEDMLTYSDSVKKETSDGRTIFSAVYSEFPEVDFKGFFLEKQNKAAMTMIVENGRIVDIEFLAPPIRPDDVSPFSLYPEEVELKMTFSRYDGGVPSLPSEASGAEEIQ